MEDRISNENTFRLKFTKNVWDVPIATPSVCWQGKSIDNIGSSNAKTRAVGDITISRENVFRNNEKGIT